jgi:hypothetical protein
MPTPRNITTNSGAQITTSGGAPVVIFSSPWVAFKTAVINVLKKVKAAPGQVGSALIRRISK